MRRRRPGQLRNWLAGLREAKEQEQADRASADAFLLTAVESGKAIPL